MALQLVLFTLFVAFLNHIASASECFSNLPFRRFKIGAINGTVVSDGPVFFNFSTFTSIPNEFVSRSFARSFRPTDEPTISQNVVVLDMPSARVIIDAGAVNIPAFPALRETGRFLKNLAAAGMSPESIDGVLLTHGHGDHITGITTVDGKRAFPNAKIYIADAEHEFWTTTPLPNPKPAILSDDLVAELQDEYLRSIKPYENRVVLVPRGGSPFPGVKFIPAPGHTAGYVLIRVRSRGDSLLLAGDTWLTTPDQLENPEWGFFFESDESQAYKTRIRVLKDAARSKELIHISHEEFPGLGFVSADGASFRWTAASNRLLGTGDQTGDQRTRCDVLEGK